MNVHSMDVEGPAVHSMEDVTGKPRILLGLVF
jgi:hypothetical protein